MGIIDPIALLRRLCQSPSETEWLEFKLNNFEADACGKYISGLGNSAMLANQAHGYLIFGVSNKAHEIVGTSVRLKNERVGNEPFENWVCNMLDPRISLQFLSFDVDEKPIEMVVVEPAWQKPIRFKGTSFIRVGQQLKRLDEYPDRARTLWMISSRYAFEAGVAEAHVTASDIRNKFDINALFKLIGRAVNSEEAAFEYLTMEGLVTDDLQGGYDVSNLLALSCAKDLKQFPSLVGKAPRVVIYQGKTKLDGATTIIGQGGYAIAFPKLLKYLMSRIPFREVMFDGVRRTFYSYPEEAVRELVANALIHQDFSIGEGYPLVEIFDDRMAITNPGDPLVEIDRFIDTPSKTRNAKLANLMRRANLCEERGSGVDKALRAIEADALPPPTFRVSDRSTIVTMFKEKPYASLSRDDRIRGCYQHACLCHESGAAMSNGTLRKRFALRSHSQASEVIADALSAQLIRPVHEDQGNRTARYLPSWA